MTTLTQLFTGIANAIRSKTGGTAQIAAENFPAEIAAISTGTDTSDANATAANIEEGKTAYVNGQKVTGSLMVLGDTYQGTATPKVTNGMVSLGRNLGQKLVVPTTSKIEFLAPYSAFGTATAADVAAGKTFTGADGLNIVGTAKQSAAYLEYLKTKVITGSVKNSVPINNISLEFENVTPDENHFWVYLTIACEELAISKVYAVYFRGNVSVPVDPKQVAGDSADSIYLRRGYTSANTISILSTLTVAYEVTITLEIYSIS